MGVAGNAAIRDIAPLEIIDALNSFYAMEMVAMHFTLAVQNRLEGQALFLRNSELDEKAEEFRGHATKLAERIGQLGGAIPADPSSFVEVSPFQSFALPDSNSEVGTILSYVLEQERVAITAYSEFIERIRDRDLMTQHDLLGILSHHVTSEADLEAVLTKS